MPETFPTCIPCITGYRALVREFFRVLFLSFSIFSAIVMTSDRRFSKTSAVLLAVQFYNITISECTGCISYQENMCKSALPYDWKQESRAKSETFHILGLEYQFPSSFLWFFLQHHPKKVPKFFYFPHLSFHSVRPWTLGISDGIKVEDTKI